ncbi:SEC-C metal-binding domain-containing protein [Fusibacter sp. 3D3]|uniref:SEC-C metal-binding domain-containing protein n=1 Tax=Fusibacter sp. 3D3 TaxID=1048380 RepID=UPI000852F377|nr:SEC-C metal-binding domain-containing protein [Fusibacter sp. 3D3]GAU77948.1 protein export cytoplasm protein SecA ATPase RNA helicase [Fusibacter sp. 3D3]
MTLYDSWNEILEGKGIDQAQSDAFWNEYLSKEKDIYAAILESKSTKISSTIADFCKTYDLEPVLCLGFLDGINTSLETEVDLETITEESAFELSIDLEKLYFNMHKAKAEWLYTIPVWDEILTKEKQKEIKRTYGDSVTVRIEEKIGRNDPCPCGSGKKYKKCCLNK